MRVLVCGGRDYGDEDHLFEVLDLRHRQSVIALLIHGDAIGADRLADWWATNRGINIARVPALWTAHGKAAGYRRNAAMLLLQPDLVVAFPGGRGTANMVSLAERAGIPVQHVPSRLQEEEASYAE